MNKFISIILGLILLAGSIFVWGNNITNFGTAIISLIKGGILLIALLIGLVLVIIGLNELRN